jgi:hypothetical protein
MQPNPQIQRTGWTWCLATARRLGPAVGGCLGAGRHPNQEGNATPPPHLGTSHVSRHPFRRLLSAAPLGSNAPSLAVSGSGRDGPARRCLGHALFALRTRPPSLQGARKAYVAGCFTSRSARGYFRVRGQTVQPGVGHGAAKTTRVPYSRISGGNGG